MQALEQLTIYSPKCLPRPHAFPNLCSLMAGSCDHATAHNWMTQLWQLTSLQNLKLTLVGIPREDPPEDEEWVEEEDPPAAAVPALPGLTRLELNVTHALMLRVSLASMATLQELVVHGSKCFVDLTVPPSGGLAGSTARCLERLSIKAQKAALDFGITPALRAASLLLSTSPVLENASGCDTIAAATQLETLRVGVTNDARVSHPREWLLELLQHVPRTLRGLALQGVVWPEAMDMAAALPHLHTLCLLSSSDADAVRRCKSIWANVQRVYLDVDRTSAPHLFSLGHPNGSLPWVSQCDLPQFLVLPDVPLLCVGC